MTNPTPLLEDTTLYLCDNGACYCGAHCGMSARYTGRDISGQDVDSITPDEAREHGIRCEKCGSTGGAT